MAGLYLHVPFCKQACHYCDFHFSTDVSPRTELVEALVQEMILQKEYQGSEPLETAAQFAGALLAAVIGNWLFAGPASAAVSQK